MKRSLARVAISLGLSGALAMAAPGTASAQEANGFGEKHELIVSADRLLPLFSYSSESTTETDNAGVQTKRSDSETSLVFLAGREARPLAFNPHTIPRVALDYAVIDHLTIGGSFVLAFGLGGTLENENGKNPSKRDAPKATLIGFAPRVGYVLPIGHVFGFWPRAGLAVYSISAKADVIRQNNVTETTSENHTLWSLDLDPQFVWVPLQHFFVHFGPIMNIPITGSKSTESSNGGSSVTRKDDASAFHFGVTAGLGGWFDL